MFVSGANPNSSKVVSENMCKEELIAVGKVLRRKPVIWDNLHANDYDHQRMFLGPYSGRDPSIIPYLSGVMTNPNCEYSLNLPSIFTLVTWLHCYDKERLSNQSSSFLKKVVLS
jgi:protein O-GlcNAcase/histone acetyltransferase